MNIIRKKYQILVIAALFVFGLTISIVYYFAIKSFEKTYQGGASKSIIEVKKDFLKDTVNNLILNIEKKQDEQIRQYSYLVEDLEFSLKTPNGLTGESYLDFALENLRAFEDISFLISEHKTGKILYQSDQLTGQTADQGSDQSNYPGSEIINKISEESAVFSQNTYSGYDVLIYVENNVVDSQVKSQIYDEIHGYSFSNDAYIWVNEVIDFNGGDNYAIRLIHPNLKDTEGMYLSTNMTDIAGNLPYLTELEGVKKDGELFFNYFFKKKDSDKISEKITYAKLYNEYNWIIAMGVHLDDVQAYVDNTATQSDRNTRGLVIVVASITLTLTAVALIFIFLLEKWYFKNANKELNEKVFKDHLTTSYNRRAAESILVTLFKDFKATGQNAILIMIDLDNFKKINDECGHDKGDIVLKQTAEIINSNIRSTDHLCRWGGDEFLMICPDMKEHEIAALTEKLLGLVSRLEIECLPEEDRHSITLSMGVSSFTKTDDGFEDSIIRADKALYRSKALGKNCVSFE